MLLGQHAISYFKIQLSLQMEAHGNSFLQTARKDQLFHLLQGKEQWLLQGAFGGGQTKTSTLAYALHQRHYQQQ